ncbi:MAG: sulfurtransferase [Bacteroidales bacterium]|nr:sulfurtransferase [Bacteroidales bacterium]
MKKLRILSITLIVLFVAGKTLIANPLIIDAKSFAAELKTNKTMVVIDVQAADVYAKQHIQGAINIPHKSLYKEGPIEGQFKDAAELAAIFGKKGVSNTAKIILYDDGSQKYSSRIWWVLKYLGATDVYLFHKEMGQMEAARIPLTATAKTLAAATFEVSLNSEMNIDMAAVKALSGNPDAIVLDNREKDEFDGMDKDKRSKGHLPGAVFMNFKEVLTTTGAYKTKDEIIATAAKFGVTPEKEVVVYCQTGIKAAVVYIALKEIAGFQNVKLYAGAYAEWASVADNPIVK